MHPLDGARLKFSRAVEHLNALNEAVKGFNDTNPCTIVPELNEQTGECVLRVKILKTPTLEWAVVIGDIAHELRSLLDHMVWQLALSQVTLPYGKTEFPIFTGSALYNRDGLRKIPNLSASQKAFIEGLQPYHAGQDAYTHPLWLLHELNNTDKHRLLPITNLVIVYGPDPPGQFGIRFRGGDFTKEQTVQLELTMHPQLGVPMEDNAKFATFKALDWGFQEQMEVYAKVTSSIFFGKSLGANSGRRVDKTLESIFKQTDTILSDCAKQFF